MARFRFTIPAFYLAAVGLLLREGMDIVKAVVLLIITLAVWTIELRNRQLIEILRARGEKIETGYWHHRAEGDETACYTSLRILPAVRTRIFGCLVNWTTTGPISHSNALDALFGLMIIVSVWSIIYSAIH